jgi:hypothetical protein
MFRPIVPFSILLAQTLSAHAFPSVGDHVEFEADYQGRKIFLEKSVKTYEPDTDRFGVRFLMHSSGSVYRDEILSLPRGFLYSPEKIANVLATCVSREGALGRERIQDRTVEVCEFYHEDSQMTTVLGKVPFGQVRFQEYLGEGEFLDFHLVRFQSGN